MNTPFAAARCGRKIRSASSFQVFCGISHDHITEEVLLTTGWVRTHHSWVGPLEFCPCFSDGVVHFLLILGLKPEILRLVLRSE